MRLRSFASVIAVFRVGLRSVRALLARLGDEQVKIYRPEAHYMRGPGPAWRAKHRQR